VVVGFRTEELTWGILFIDTSGMLARLHSYWFYHQIIVGDCEGIHG
jgi:hypothetical protein